MGSAPRYGFGRIPKWPTPPTSLVSPPVRDEILATLVGNLGLTRLRPILQPGIEPGQRQGGPIRPQGRRLRLFGTARRQPYRSRQDAVQLGVAHILSRAYRLEEWMTEDNARSVRGVGASDAHALEGRGNLASVLSPIN